MQTIEPFPEIEHNVPSATLTLSLPEQGVYEWNRVEDPVIWSEAPESIIQEWNIEAALKAEGDIPE